MVLNNIAFSYYRPGKSLLHRLQARTKLLLFDVLLVCLTIANRHQWHFLPYIVAAGLVGIGISLSGISLKEYWRQMWLLLLLAVLAAIPVLLFPDGKVQAFYTFGPYALPYPLLLLVAVVPFFLLRFQTKSMKENPRFRLFGTIGLLCVGEFISTLLVSGVAFRAGDLLLNQIRITYQGVWLIMPFLVIFLILFAYSLMLTMTTEPLALIEGLTILLGPLRRLGLPIDDFALMTLIALRFIPTMLDEIDQLMKAQSARGADLASGDLRERIQSAGAFFIPLMEGVFRRSTELATALESRGYDSQEKRTRLHERSLTLIDYICLGITLLCMAGSLFW